MGKAITAIGEIAGAVALGAVAFALASTGVGFAALPFLLHASVALGVAGVGEGIGAIADALGGNKGQAVTTRQPAAFRQIVYGTQRVGGIQVFQSTTGSSHDQYNLVIAIAGHECWALENLWLDGRQVYWQGSGAGWSVRNGYGFGGVADGNDHIGPDGSIYNFGGTGHSGIYCEARFGDQLPGDVIGGLTANDPSWAATAAGSPYLGGCTYVYLKIEYNPQVFPNFPEIRFTVKGKPVFDPRTGQTAYSANPALIINDILQDPRYGLNDTSVNQAQLIAAANICDEQVPTATQGNETRYAAHGHYDTSVGAGDAIGMALAAMGGRMARISGEWHLFPAAWIPPQLSFGPDQMVGPAAWKPKRAYRELVNQVRGTYTAPIYPYNVAGDYYDNNGWAAGHIQNNFNGAFQLDNYPDYAEDAGHGYAADQYLAQDGGQRLTKELALSWVLSITQAQRLAKIALLRNRYQGAGNFTFNVSALQLQPCDTFFCNFPRRGWAGKVLEVNKFTTSLGSGESGAPQLSCSLGVNETGPDIYAWKCTTEEQTVYGVPALPTPGPLTPVAPTDLTVSVSGNVLQLNWTAPAAAQAIAVNVQYQAATDSGFSDYGNVSADTTSVSIQVAVAPHYNVQIRTQYVNGAYSAWVEASV